MLVKADNISVDEYINEFKKRFTNFCDKAPILLSFKTTLNKVYVHNENTNEIKVFDFDFSKSVKSQIKEIKDWLVETQYPIMIETKVSYEDYTAEEIKEMVDKGIDPDKALQSKKEKVDVTKWRIEKVIVRRDELFVRNLTSGILYRYKLKMPCILFLKKFREKLDGFQAWELFERKSVLLNEVEEERE